MNIAKFEWNEYLVGFVATLDDGRKVQVQFEKEQNRLHADFGTYSAVIDKENDYGLNLSDEEEGLFYALLKSEYDHVIKPIESALDSQLLSYYPDLKIAKFNGVLLREGAVIVSAAEEAHNVNSIEEARSIWGILEDDNISEELVE